MYLFCYARSEKAIETGKKLLAATEGEWINDIESFSTNPPDTVSRADGAIVMIIPAEAAIKLIIERIYPSDIRFPVITVSPEGSWAGVLRRGGYNDYAILGRVCDILGCQALSRDDDRKHYVPNLSKSIADNELIPDSKETLAKISDMVTNGQKIDVYTDLNVDLAEPVLDSLSFGLYHYRSSQLQELRQAYENACKSSVPAIFITCSAMPEVADKGMCLLLVPKRIVVGIEVGQRTDPDYAADAIIGEIQKHNINPVAVKSLATVSSAKDSVAIELVAKKVGAEVKAYDSKIIKSVKLPYDGSFGSVKNSASDICTAAASLASDSGRILVKRAGDRNSAVVSIARISGEITI